MGCVAALLPREGHRVLWTRGHDRPSGSERDELGPIWCGEEVVWTGQVGKPLTMTGSSGWGLIRMRQPSMVIAVVEDSEGLRVALGRLLRAAGYHTALYESAEAYLAQPPQISVCLLLDVNLPGMSGLDLLRLLRTKPMAPSIILMSADRSLAEGAEGLGCAAFFPKPMPIDALLLTVASLVDHQVQLRARESIE